MCNLRNKISRQNIKRNSFIYLKITLDLERIWFWFEKQKINCCIESIFLCVIVVTTKSRKIFLNKLKIIIKKKSSDLVSLFIQCDILCKSMHKYQWIFDLLDLSTQFRTSMKICCFWWFFLLFSFLLVFHF